MGVDVKVIDNSDSVLSAKESAIARALEMIGLKAERYAKEGCPVDTGRLRNSISHATDEDSVYIGTNVEYAPYVELGTYGRAEHPFLAPAAEDHIDEYKSIIESEMRKA